MEKSKSKNYQKTIGKKTDYEKIAAENLAGWQRERADFENYRKRIEKRSLDLIKFANQELLLKILPILDHLEAALKQTPKGWEKTSWVEGIKQIRNHFKNILETEGLKEIDVQIDKKFDPCFCEAVEKVNVKKENNGDEKAKTQENRITEVLQKGYMLHGKVARPAKVKVE